ncbi:Callose synthase 12 [Hordeum vulgare]|nr:Callose synthase 12 [Hordeum vulgare]
MVLFVFPYLRKAVDKTNWRVCYALTWWLRSRIYVGRGLRGSTLGNVRYSAFWILVLAVKFSFSYFLQIRPLVAPTKEIYGLSTAAYASWHDLFRRHNNPFTVLLLWFPVVLIYLMDIQIWYVIFSSLAGAWLGLFLHLGEIRDMQQLRLRFHFFASVMSFNIMPEEERGNENGGAASNFLIKLGATTGVPVGVAPPVHARSVVLTVQAIVVQPPPTNYDDDQGRHSSNSSGVLTAVLEPPPPNNNCNVGGAAAEPAKSPPKPTALPATPKPKDVDVVPPATAETKHGKVVHLFKVR